MKKTKLVCTRCIMDETVSNIVFDAQGVCNYCTTYFTKYSDSAIETDLQVSKRNDFHKTVRQNGKGKKYDCIVGVSGGIDSSYALYLAVKNGIRPLAVHLDNGWDSEIAQNNIANLVRKLGVDLHTHVIDWNENRDMQRALIKSGVIDLEIIMDNAQAATNYRQALKLGLSDILSGTNTRTEGMPIPPNWTHYKFDEKNIRTIQSKFGNVRIKTHPLMNTLDWLYYEYVRNIHWHNYLDYFVYDKEEAIKILEKDIGYIRYQYKHGESVYTRFYQNYILPKKFGVDKRIVHYSTLICSGQMSRDEAIAEIKNNRYIGTSEAESDYIYVLKKLGLKESEFTEYMKKEPVAHEAYSSELPTLRLLQKIRNLFRKKVINF